MSYTRQNFKSGDTLYASQLNTMDGQIAQSAQDVSALGTRLTNAETAVRGKYEKPSGGIPKTDLSLELQNAINSAQGEVQRRTTKLLSYVLDYTEASVLDPANAYFPDVVIPKESIFTGFKVQLGGNVTNGSTLKWYLARYENGRMVPFYRGSEALTTAHQNVQYHVSCGEIVIPDDCYLGINSGSVIYRFTNDESMGTVTGILSTTAPADLETDAGAEARRYDVQVSYMISLSVDMYVTVGSVQALRESLESGSYIGFQLNRGNRLRFAEGSGEIGYFGRWFDYETGGHTYKCTNNSGAEMHLRTQGADSLTLTFGTVSAMSDGPYIAYSVDGGAFTRVSAASPVTIALQNSTDNDGHVVRVVMDAMNQTESGSGKWEKTLGVYLADAAVDKGSMKALNVVGRVGLFLGDSITEGVRALGTTQDSSVAASYNSATGAFPYFCCKALGAAAIFAGYGASGMTVAGSFQPCIKAVNYLANGVSVPEYHPDFIVINHGQNDGDANVTASAYITAYRQVIQRLDALYPGVPVFMAHYFTDTKYAEAMRELADEYPQCYFVDTQGWDGERSDWAHLTSAGAQNNGEKLAEAILSVMGKAFFVL